MPFTMNVLITGGLGVNGSWVTRKLVQRGLSPVVYDQQLNTELVGPEAQHATLLRGDINDIAALIRTLREHEIECIVHMAGMVVGTQQELFQAFRVNALGTVQVLEAARVAGVRRVVYTSSRAVSGDVTGAAAHPTYEPMDEEYRVAPAATYDVCKVAGEVMGRNYAGVHGLEFVALRFAAIVGPGKPARHGGNSVYSAMIEESLAGRRFRVPRGGDQVDDLIYVDDAAEGVVLAALHDRPTFDTYNISRGVGTTLHDLAAAVRQTVPDADIEVGAGLDPFGIGRQYYGVMSNARAQSDLGFTPRFDLAEMVDDYARVSGVLGLRAAEPTATSG